MFDEPGRDDAAPEQCRYCGARMKAPLIFCPQCGANLLAKPSPEAEAMLFPDALADPPARGGLSERLLNAMPWARHRARMSDAAMPFDYAPHDEPAAPPPRRSRAVWGGVAMIGVVIGAYAMFHRGPSTPRHGVQIIEGKVLRPLGASAALAANPPVVPMARTSTLPVIPAMPAAPIAPAVPTAPVAPVDDASEQAQEASFGQRNSPGPKPSAYANSAVTKDLLNARAALDRHSLWPARKAVTSALAAQPSNPDAQQLRTELVAREQERDALIGDARQCAHARQWTCVRRSAGRAASVDISSREAKRLLARASGGEPSRPANPLDVVVGWIERHAPPSRVQSSDRYTNDNSPYQH